MLTILACYVISKQESFDPEEFTMNVLCVIVLIMLDIVTLAKIIS